MRPQARRWSLAIAWVIGAGAVWLLMPHGDSSIAADAMATDTYYVVVHTSRAVPLAAGMSIFGLIYLVLDASFRAEYSRSLAWAQFAIAALGVLLLSAPPVAPTLSMPRRYMDDATAVEALAGPYRAGWPCLVASLLLFAAVLVSAAIRVWKARRAD